MKPYITPVTVAYWFAGDGGKTDFTKSKSKGISFHSQGFTLEDNQLLAKLRNEN